MAEPELAVKRPLRRAPTHPGELMREILEEHARIPIAEAARRMDVSRQSLHAILRGESAVTPDMALRFGRLTGGSADLYVNMQTKRDLWLAAHKLGDALARIEPAAGPVEPGRARSRLAAKPGRTAKTTEHRAMAKK